MRFSSSYLRWLVTVAAGGGLAFGAFTSVFNTSPTAFGQVIDSSVPVIVGTVPPKTGATINVSDTTARGTITIPANALAEAVKVHTTLAEQLPTTVGPINHVLQVVNVVADNTKNQTVSYFHQPVVITLTIKPGITEPITAVFWNALLHRWQPFADVTVHGNTIAIQTRHFTTVAVVPAREVNLVQRVAGPNAVETAIQTAETTYPDGATAAVLTGSGMGGVNSDALAATSLAGALGASMLYTPPTHLPPPVLTALHDMHTQTVYVVGGTGVVSPAVDAELQHAGLTVIRDFNGKTSVATAGLVDEYLYANHLTTAHTAFIANGTTVVGSLAATAEIYRLGAPIVLTTAGQTSLSALTLAALQQAGITNAVILGGPGSVSPKLMTQVVGVLGSNNVTRIGANTRNQTAVKVDQQYFANPTGAIVVNGGTGSGIMDGLAASGLAVMNDVPIVLTNHQQVPASSASYLDHVSLHAVWLMGGNAVVGPKVRQTVSARVQAP